MSQVLSNPLLAKSNLLLINLLNSLKRNEDKCLIKNGLSFPNFKCPLKDHLKVLTQFFFFELKKCMNNLSNYASATDVGSIDSGKTSRIILETTCQIHTKRTKLWVKMKQKGLGTS